MKYLLLLCFPSFAFAGYITTPGVNCASGSSGQVYTTNGTSCSFTTVAGTGTVTSVDMTVPNFLSVSGNPITTSGTLAVALATQVKNKVFVGPATGADAAPTFRLLVGADLPLPGAAALGGVFSKAVVANQFLTGISSVDGSVSQAQPSFSNISGTASLTTQVTGVLPVANGGTNSSSALSNNRVMQSSGGAVVEASAITASRALASDSNGIPVAATTTTTELNFVNGVTSAIQTQINTKAPSTSPAFSTQVTFGNYHMEPSESDAGNSSTAITISFANASAQKVTMTGNCTFTFTNPVTGGTYYLRLVQDGTGSRTYTWPAAVKWSGGTAPTGSGANKIDLVTFYWDGTSYYGTSSLNY